MRLVLTLLLVGCAAEEHTVWGEDNEPTEGGGGGGDLVSACESYIAAATRCAAEAFGGGSTLGGTEEMCSAYEGMRGEDALDARDYLHCLADVYDKANCTTPEGYSEAGNRAVDCL